MRHDVFPDPQTFQIIGAGMAVHSELGCGFLEAVYRAALAIELERRGVPFIFEESFRIKYKGRPLSVSYRVDFVCFDDVIVEVKALKAIGGSEEAQLLNYLKASGKRRGARRRSRRAGQEQGLKIASPMRLGL